MRRFRLGRMPGGRCEVILVLLRGRLGSVVKYSCGNLMILSSYLVIPILSMLL